MQHKQQRCAGLQGLWNIFDERSLAASTRTHPARRFTHWLGGDGGGNERQRDAHRPMREWGPSPDFAVPFTPSHHNTPDDMCAILAAWIAMSWVEVCEASFMISKEMAP